MDWAVYLEHLLAVLIIFNPIAVPNKYVFIQYFSNDCHLLIKTQLDKQGYDLNNKSKDIQKAINIKAKISQQSLSKMR